MYDKNFSANWHFPTEIFLELGSVQKLNEHLNTLQSIRPLIVIDKRLLSLPAIDQALQSLRAQERFKLSFFTEFKGNPTSNNALEGTNVYQTNQCDCVVGIGGGSALDVAKTIALLAHQNNNIWNFIDKGDNYKLANADLIPPIIAVPTTSGTGSEVGRAALITDPITHNKNLLFHPKMLPSIVICDPSLVMSLPAQLTATTGMDALAHNVEAYCAPGYHPLADGIALEGIRLIHENLLAAYQDGSNITARTNMMAASIMGASAFQKGLGAIHALSHPIGGVFDAHHGLLNAIFMPYVLQFNRRAIESKLVSLARHLDLPGHSADSVLSWIKQLNSDLNIPASLPEIDIDIAQADEIAKRALIDPSAAGNPTPLTTMHLWEILDAAISGESIKQNT